MTKTVIGLFANNNDATAALREIKDAGIGRETTTFVQQSEPQLTSRLVEAGIPQQDAALFSDGVAKGNCLIVVQGITNDDAQQANAIMERYNVVDISRQMSGLRTSSTASSEASAATMKTNQYEGQDMVVPIVEEELRIGKRMVEGGGVRVSTRIEEVAVNEQVTLRDETVAVERRSVDRPVTDADLTSMQDRTFEMREHDEEAVVSKQARVVEEVVVRKDATERTETVQDSVRRTRVDVDQLAGQSTGSGMTSADETLDVATSSTTSEEGAIERGASKMGNAVERAVGADIDRDGDIGRRDQRNNV